MAFSLVQGDRPLESNYAEPALRDDPLEGDASDAHDGDGENPEKAKEFEDAMLLNQRLKAMLAEAESKASSHNSPSGGGSGGRSQQAADGRRQPRVPRLPMGGQGGGAGYSVAPVDPLAGARENSHGINRRKIDQKVARENGHIAQRLAGCKSSGFLPPVNPNQHRPGQQHGYGEARQPESSQTINRRKFAEKVQRENANLVSRIEQPARARSWGPQRKVGDSDLPKGWTRGVGGRAMPPPKLRWGSAAKHDAGEMVF